MENPYTFFFFHRNRFEIINKIPIFVQTVDLHDRYRTLIWSSDLFQEISTEESP
jgi:hypothetical protein